MKIRHHSLQSLFVASIVFACSLPTSLHAANMYWDSNGTTTGAGTLPTGNWGTSNFWNTDINGDAGTFSTSIAATDTAVFSAGTDATGAGIITLNANTTVAGLTIEEGAPKFVSATSAKSLTVNSNVTFGKSVDFGTATGVTAVNLLLGTNTLTQTGGTFNSYGANTMGGAFLKNGNAFIGNAAAFGTTNDITIGDLAGSSSYSINLRSNVTLARPIVLQSGGTLTTKFLNASGNVNTVLSGGMTGANAVVSVQSYVTSTGGSNSNVTISGAAVNFAGPLKLENTDNNLVGIRTGLVTVSAAIGANVTDVTATNLTRVGSTGTQKIVISGANAYSGNTVIASPTDTTHTTLVQLGASNVIPDGVGHGDVSIQAGGILDLNGKSETINGLSGSGVVDNSVGTGALTIGGNDKDSIFSGEIKNSAGSLSIAKTGLGTLTLTTPNSYSGTTTIGSDSGVLEISDGAALSGGNVAITKAGITGGALSLTNNITVANNFTFSSANEFGNGGSAHIQNTSGNNILSGNLTLTSTGGNGINIESVSGKLTIEGTVSSSIADNFRMLSLSGASDGEVSGPIQDTGANKLSVVKSGAGVWTLSGANAYSGFTRVKAGTLSIPNNGSLDAASTVEIATSAFLNLNFTGTNTIEKLTFNGTRQASGTWGKIGSLANHTDARITGNGLLLVEPLFFVWNGLGGDQKWSTAANWDINAVPSTGKSLQFANTANPAITNDLAANTSIASLTFNADAANYTIAGSNLLVVTGGITNLSANNQLINFPIEFGAAIPINVGSSVLTLQGNITGAFGLSKFDSGVLELSGTNTYDGTTTLNAGVLAAINASSLPAGTTLAFTNTTSPAQLEIIGLQQTLANMTFGTQTTGGNVTIYGNASSSLTVSPASLIFAPAATPAASNLTVDMSNIGGFTYNNATGTVSLQAGSGSGSGITSVTLANTTNSITADTFKIAGANAAGGNQSILNLGLHNTLHANTILLAANQGRGSATLQYASGLDSGGSLEIRNAVGSGAANVTIGKNSSFNGDVNVYTSLIDTTGDAATLDALIGTLTIGNAHSDGATTRQVQSKGSLIMGAGTLNATSAVIGLLEGTATTGTSKYTATGLLSLSAGGTASIGTVTLAEDGMASIGGIDNLDGQITLDGSGGSTTLRATTIQQGTVVAGETSRIARINWTDGTIGNITSGDLGISGVALVLASGGSHAFDISSGQTGTVSSAITSLSGNTPLIGSRGVISSPVPHHPAYGSVQGGSNQTRAFAPKCRTLQMASISGTPCSSSQRLFSAYRTISIWLARQ